MDNLGEFELSWDYGGLELVHIPCSERVPLKYYGYSIQDLIDKAKEHKCQAV